MILGPTARPFVVLGGEFARSVRRRGELVIEFQYVNTEPAMVIWSGTRQQACDQILALRKLKVVP